MRVGVCAEAVPAIAITITDAATKVFPNIIYSAHFLFSIAKPFGFKLLNYIKPAYHLPDMQTVFHVILTCLWLPKGEISVKFYQMTKNYYTILSSVFSSPDKASRAARRWASVICERTAAIAIVKTAISSEKPITASISGIKSNGMTK